MKRVLLISLIIIFLFSTKVFALGNAATQTADLSVNMEVNYDLPYPGLLPDNPLYVLKTMRDKTVSILITDPLKKAAFDLLQADKRLAAGMMLIQNSKNFVLAEQTISKGENYFDDAIIKIREAKKQGMGINDIRSKMANAAEKHKQVITDLIKKVPDKNKPGFILLQKRIINIQKELKAFSS